MGKPADQAVLAFLERRWLRVCLVVGAWSIFVVAAMLRHASHPMHSGRLGYTDFLLAFLVYGSWALLTPAIWSLARSLSARTVLVTTLAKHAALALGTAILVDYLSHNIYHVVLGGVWSEYPLDESVREFRFLDDLILYLLLLSIGLAADYRSRLGASLRLLPTSPKLLRQERIAVSHRGVTRFVSVKNIELVVARGQYAEICANGARYLVRERMHDIEERLGKERFFRIHRSTIIRIDLVETIRNQSGGRYTVILRDGRQFRLARSRRLEFEKTLLNRKGS